METFFEIKGNVRLETPEHVYKFMKELLNYELFVTDKDYDTGLPTFEDGPTFRLNRPFMEEGVSRKGIKEFAWAIGVDAKMDALFIDLLSIGDVNRTLVTPWLSLRGTFHCAASAIYLVHNHPSGDPTPSPADIALTKEVIEGGMKMRRPLIDHIILGDNCYHAFEGQMQEFEQMVEQELIEKKALCQMINDEKADKIRVSLEYEHALQDKDDTISEKDDENKKLRKKIEELEKKYGK